MRVALSSDSCDGSAPHYEVFMELRGLRNLLEENRDKVKNDTGSGSISFVLQVLPVVMETREFRERGTREGNPSSGNLGREHGSLNTHFYTEVLCAGGLGHRHICATAG